MSIIACSDLSFPAGLVHSEMSHILFPDGLFGFKDNCCFLFVRRTLQCIQNLVLPSPPFLMAVLIQRFEVPWAKVFPLRLVLRLGAEFGSYPCPILSYRQRKAVYCEVGHTILNVLAVSTDSRSCIFLSFPNSGLSELSVHDPRDSGRCDSARLWTKDNDTHPAPEPV